MRKLVLGIGLGCPEPAEKQIEVIAKAGFDGVFTGWDENKPIAGYKKIIDANGLIYQSVHAPFTKVHMLWEADERGDKEEAIQLACLRESAENGVSKIIMHTFIGFNADKYNPTSVGVDRYGRLLDEAEKLGVKIALENTEGECYLDRLMTDLRSHNALGFCIDTGHEMCYNHCHDLIGKYGDKLICTHLNDNMKQTSEIMTWLDDSHLLPYDGLADWDMLAERLKKVGYGGELTFELTKMSKPERNTHAIYDRLNFEEFVALIYEKAVKFAKNFED